MGIVERQSVADAVEQWRATRRTTARVKRPPTVVTRRQAREARAQQEEAKQQEQQQRDTEERGLQRKRQRKAATKARRLFEGVGQTQASCQASWEEEEEELGSDRGSLVYASETPSETLSETPSETPSKMDEDEYEGEMMTPSHRRRWGEPATPYRQKRGEEAVSARLAQPMLVTQSETEDERDETEETVTRRWHSQLLALASYPCESTISDSHPLCDSLSESDGEFLAVARLIEQRITDTHGHYSRYVCERVLKLSPPPRSPPSASARLLFFSADLSTLAHVAKVRSFPSTLLQFNTSLCAADTLWRTQHPHFTHGRARSRVLIATVDPPRAHVMRWNGTLSQLRADLVARPAHYQSCDAVHLTPHTDSAASVLVVLNPSVCVPSYLVEYSFYVFEEDL